MSCPEKCPECGGDSVPALTNVKTLNRCCVECGVLFDKEEEE